MCKLQCGLILVLTNLLGAVGLFLFSKEIVDIYNFEVGYVSFFVIAITSLLSAKRIVHNKLDTIQDYPKEEKKRKNKPSKFILGIELSFFWSRILGYMLLIAGLFFLMYLKIFVFWAYLLGISLSAFIIILLQFINLKKSKS